MVVVPERSASATSRPAVRLRCCDEAARVAATVVRMPPAP